MNIQLFTHSLTSNIDDVNKLKEVFVSSFEKSYLTLNINIADGLRNFLEKEFDKEIEILDQNKNRKIYVLEDSDKKEIIGLVMYDIIDDDTIYLAQMAISPEWQCQGYAKFLLQNLHKNIYGLVRRLNIPGYNLYMSKMGGKEWLRQDWPNVLKERYTAEYVGFFISKNP